MGNLVDLNALEALHIKDEEVTEVLIGSRWIKIRQGTYTEAFNDVRFLSEDGRAYNTKKERVQLKVR